MFVATLNLWVCMKALGRARGKDLQDHFGLRQWINTEGDLVEIAEPYRYVEEWSRDARYEGRRFSGKDLERFYGWFIDARDKMLARLKAHGLTNLPVLDPVRL
jgi:hypothetical protein